MGKRTPAEIGLMLQCDVPSEIPVLPLMSTIVFPLGVTSIQVRIEQSKALLRDHSDPDTLVALVYSPAKREEDIRPTELSRTGLSARVIRSLHLPAGSVQVTLEGLRRVEIGEFIKTEPYLVAKVTCPEEKVQDPEQVHDLIQRVLRSLRTLSQIDNSYPPELDHIFSMNLGDPGLFADTVASAVRL